MFFLCLLLNWLYLNHLAQACNENKVITALYMYVFDVMVRMMLEYAGQQINMIGPNSCLDVKNIHCAI